MVAIFTFWPASGMVRFNKGVTSNLINRITEHRDKTFKGFTSKHNVCTLVYYEFYDRIEDAIKREKQVKEWKRNWTLELIEEKNPEWKDLYEDIIKL